MYFLCLDYQILILTVSLMTFRNTASIDILSPCLLIFYGVHFQNGFINFTYLLEYSGATHLESSIFISRLAITELSLPWDGYSPKAEVLGAHVFKGPRS